MGLACPSEADRASFLEACRKGHITWTALPWNGQAELMDPVSLASAAHVTFYLDADVGVAKKTVVSQVRRISARAASHAAPQCAARALLRPCARVGSSQQHV